VKENWKNWLKKAWKFVEIFFKKALEILKITLYLLYNGSAT